MPEWVKECLTKHWRLSWASKSRLGTDPRLGRLAVTAADGGRRPQEKDKLSDKPTVRCKASAGRPTPESKRASVCVGRRACECACTCVCLKMGTSRGGIQATDESPSVFAGEWGRRRGREANSRRGAPASWVYPLRIPQTHPAPHQRGRLRAFRDFLLMCEYTQSTLTQSDWHQSKLEGLCDR